MRGQTSSIMKRENNTKGALFLVCPFWSGVGYDFRGNYGSV